MGSLNELPESTLVLIPAPARKGVVSALLYGRSMLLGIDGNETDGCRAEDGEGRA
ncbi:unnamed protein product, partial [Mycena citricolor]